MCAPIQTGFLHARCLGDPNLPPWAHRGPAPPGLHPTGRTREGSWSPAAAVVACARDTVTPPPREGAARGGWEGQEVGPGLPVGWVHDAEPCRAEGQQRPAACCGIFGVVMSLHHSKGGKTLTAHTGPVPTKGCSGAMWGLLQPLAARQAKEGKRTEPQHPQAALEAGSAQPGAGGSADGGSSFSTTRVTISSTSIPGALHPARVWGASSAGGASRSQVPRHGVDSVQGAGWEGCTSLFCM